MSLTRMLIIIVSHHMSLFLLGIIFKCFGWVGSSKITFSSEFVSSQIWCYLIYFIDHRKKFSVWICIESNLVLFHLGWVGGCLDSPEKQNFSLNFNQAKCGVIHFRWVGVGGLVLRKKLSVQIHVKPNLVLSHFVWVGGWCQEKHLSLN